ncbi:VTT domain-containing protein [Oceanobacillus chungangensis]|uniref:Alkaline phosphatase n=1 Tax=Oceanobacillus chungangensis TaxID=1229152 RepID=A0A3D8PQ50_9BACI|nr:VTT domain-containing protein [Oceanobacillus chungangensis]RDW17677.1 alkaline phosphatase [Oceanobacillus chungangensis]
MGNITAYIDQYGYVVLFVALLLELIALPLPGEILMSYTGFLVFQGRLNWILSILIAGFGSCIGMTISYWIGYKVGQPFFEKYGSRFHMGPERIEKFSHWFSKYGNKLLLIAYFIPGIRHITGYFSGTTRLPFRMYAVFAYTGAFLWVTVFITLGKVLGPQWEAFHSSIKKYLIIGGIAVAVVFIVLFIYKKFKEEIKETVIRIINLTLTIFHTRRRVGFLLTVTSILTLGLMILMFGMIEDFLGNEFTNFNQTVDLLNSLIFNKDWIEAMQIFLFLGSRQVQLILISFTIIWIIWKGENRLIELGSLLIVILVGELFEESLRRIFQILSPVHYSSKDHLFRNFPSEQSLMNFVIYGFAVFICVRFIKNAWVHTLVPVSGLGVLILIAISRLFFKVELPSDIAAGYVFGGVWLSLNILLLEIFRLLRRIDID